LRTPVLSQAHARACLPPPPFSFPLFFCTPRKARFSAEMKEGVRARTGLSLFFFSPPLFPAVRIWTRFPTNPCWRRTRTSLFVFGRPVPSATFSPSFSSLQRTTTPRQSPPSPLTRGSAAITCSPPLFFPFRRENFNSLFPVVRRGRIFSPLLWLRHAADHPCTTPLGSPRKT